MIEIREALGRIADRVPVEDRLTEIVAHPDERLVALNEVTVAAKTATGEARNRRPLLMAAAAAVVVIGVAGLALAITHNDDNGQGPAPVATVSVAPPTTSATTDTVRFVVTSAHDIPVTFTVPKSWERLLHAGYSSFRQGAAVQFDSVSNIYSDGCQHAVLDPPVGPSVDDLVTAWANERELAPTAPVDINVDGHTGKQIEFTLPDISRTCQTSSFPVGFGVWIGTEPTPGLGESIVPNQHFRMLVLDVDGTRLLIAASTSPSAPLRDRTALENLLASIQIGQPAQG